jgi:hypothetical protein
VGGHPAFNVPFFKGENYEDYYLEFESDEHHWWSTCYRQTVFSAAKHASGSNGWQKPGYSTRDLFAADALVFKNMQSRQVTIRSNKHDETVSVDSSRTLIT